MKNIVSMLAVVMVTLMLTGCGEGFIKPFKEVVRVPVESNESAFVVPLLGENLEKQKNIMSIAYLEKNKVQSKLIEIPQKWVQTGRAFIWSTGKYIDTVKVIKVNMSPQSRKWDDVKTKGKAVDDGFTVESSDSIGFIIGAVTQAKINQRDASLFLASYSGNNLTSILDADVRSFIGNILTRECGKLDIEACKLGKSKIFKTVKDETVKHFKQYGITITHLGQSGQINYINEDIQKAIDKKATADAAVKVAKKEQKRKIIEATTKMKQQVIEQEKETALAKEKQKREKVQFETKKQNALIAEQQKIEVATKQALMQGILNKKDMEVADAARYIKEQKQSVIGTITELTKLDILKLEAEAKLAYARNHKGGTPRILVNTSGNSSGSDIMKQMIPVLNVNKMLDN